MARCIFLRGCGGPMEDRSGQTLSGLDARDARPVEVHHEPQTSGAGPVNLAWRDALAAVRLPVFTPEEKLAGWPADMTALQLAELQRPCRSGDRAARLASDALKDELSAGCASGAIPHDTKTVMRQQWRHITMVVRFESMHWDGIPGKTRSVPKLVTTSEQRNAISAAVFASWLAEQGISPSEHIAAWFKARGIESQAKVLQLVPSKLESPSSELDAAGEAALRDRIRSHQAMRKVGRKWPDATAMRAELLRQYEDRIALTDAESSICEEQLGDLWDMKPNTVHTYLTEARNEGKQSKAKTEGKPSKSA